jgi:outer membrane lipoprotein LolB
LLQFVRLSASTLALALLLSCASGPPVAPVESTAFIDEFELKGRVAVKFDGRGYSARLRWLHEATSDEMWLYSPLGSTVATVVASGDHATLVTAKKETFSSDNVQQLTRDVLGWDLPLTGLRHWVLGRADPGVPVMLLELDDQLRIKQLTQSDWQIDYLAYSGDSALPSSMVLRYNDLRMRLIIDGWKFPSVAQ